MTAKVKFCGLQTREDIAAVNATRPDYVGFVFAPSKRQASPGTVARLRSELDPGIVAVGIFVNHDPLEIVGLVREGVIDCVQLHGDEDAEYIVALRSLTDALIIKAQPVSDAIPPHPLGADYALYDTAPLPTEARGGSGRTFSWSLLSTVKQPFFLAGGLTEGNVAEAISTTRPYCVDVSSGVETDGRKDTGKMKAFLQAAREADQRMENVR